MCCKDKLGETNKYLKAYTSYAPVTKESRIIGHKKCFDKIFQSARVWGLKGEIVSYFKSLGVRIRRCKDLSFEFSYEDEKLTSYIDLL
jgi:hypothetical protein